MDPGLLEHRTRSRRRRPRSRNSARTWLSGGRLVAARAREVREGSRANPAQPQVELSILVRRRRRRNSRPVKFLRPPSGLPNPSTSKISRWPAGFLARPQGAGPPTHQHLRRVRPGPPTEATSSVFAGPEAALRSEPCGSSSSIASIPSRTSPISLRRSFGSFARQRRSSRRTAAGVAAGRADQSGSRSRILRDRCPLPCRRRTSTRPVSIS